MRNKTTTAVFIYVYEKIWDILEILEHTFCVIIDIYINICFHGFICHSQTK